MSNEMKKLEQRAQRLREAAANNLTESEVRDILFEAEHKFGITPNQLADAYQAIRTGNPSPRKVVMREPMVSHSDSKLKTTILDIEALRKLADHMFLKDVTDPIERDLIIWQFIAGQFDRMGIIVEAYHRSSVYTRYAEEMMNAVIKNDTIISNNINHIPGGSVVRLRTMPLHLIIERLQ